MLFGKSKKKFIVADYGSGIPLNPAITFQSKKEYKDYLAELLEKDQLEWSAHFVYKIKGQPIYQLKEG